MLDGSVFKRTSLGLGISVVSSRFSQLFIVVLQRLYIQWCKEI